MFPTRKRIVLLHLNGNVIHTTADHPLYVPGQGWTSAAEMPTEARSDDGEQEIVYHLNLGEQAMSDQPSPNHAISGFVAGTPILTAKGPVSIEKLRPGDIIQVQPDHGPDDHEPEAHENNHADAPRWWERN